MITFVFQAAAVSDHYPIEFLLKQQQQVNISSLNPTECIIL